MHEDQLDVMYADTANDITIFGSTLHGTASFTHNGAELDFGIEENGSWTISGGIGDLTITHFEFGYRELETDFGYVVEFETGETQRYADLNREGVNEQHVELTDLNLDGAFGDDQDNILRATGHIAAVAISGGAGDDYIRGGWMADRLSGDAGEDNIRGGEGNDLIFFDAADVSVPGGGTVTGDGGRDTAVLIDFDAVDANGNDTFASGVTFDLQANGFEIARGGDGDDHFSVLSNFVARVDLSLGAGNDTGSGGRTDDVLSGDAGDDHLTGNNGDDALFGGEGSDTLIGGEGDDLATGGAGDDQIIGGDGDDLLNGGEGADSIEGGQGDDYLTGGEGNDTLSGGTEDDLVFAGAGDDEVHGGSGDDRLNGGDGNDTLFGNDGDDHITGGAGNDAIHLGRNGDTFAAGGGWR